MFSCDFYGIFKSTFLLEHLQVSAPILAFETTNCIQEYW